MALVLWYGGHKVAAGTMTPGVMTAFILYLTILQAPVRQVIMIVMSAARATTCGSRLFEILDLDASHRRQAGRASLWRRPTACCGSSTSTSPMTRASPSCTTSASRSARARRWASSARRARGKSTIANLVPRFYDVTGGRITIDDVDIRDVTLASLREYVGLVQQEAFLFDSTVTNNVAYADPWAEEERIVGATKTAQLHDYIAQLPGAYGTRVGERGVALSGGQRQRMSIARGVVPWPRHHDLRRLAPRPSTP